MIDYGLLAKRKFFNVAGLTIDNSGHVFYKDDSSRAEYWADIINAKAQKTVELIYQIGKDLIRAKAKLRRGEWQRLFRAQLLHIGLREAQRFMQIAKCEFLGNATNWSRLPASPHALVALSTANRDKLRIAMDKGVVSPSMTISQAKLFASRSRTDVMELSASADSARYDVLKASAALIRTLTKELARCPAEQRRDLLTAIQGALAGMSA